MNGPQPCDSSGHIEPDRAPGEPAFPIAIIAQSLRRLDVGHWLRGHAGHICHPNGPDGNRREPFGFNQKAEGPPRLAGWGQRVLNRMGLGSLREFGGFHHHQPLGMFLGVFRAKKNTAYEFARLADLMTDDRPTSRKTQRAGFINSRHRIANSHIRTLSPPGPDLIQPYTRAWRCAFARLNTPHRLRRRVPSGTPRHAWENSGTRRRHCQHSFHATAAHFAHFLLQKAWSLRSAVGARRDFVRAFPICL